MVHGRSGGRGIWYFDIHVLNKFSIPYSLHVFSVLYYNTKFSTKFSMSKIARWEKILDKRSPQILVASVVYFETGTIVPNSKISIRGKFSGFAVLQYT
jgi:hypothetical protein